ncbi:hypothetical protein EV368DRAFT_13287, partial [Lentinula lateritia]
VYDSRSRSLLFRVGSHLSLSWWDIVVFEGRIGRRGHCRIKRRKRITKKLHCSRATSPSSPQSAYCNALHELTRPGEGLVIGLSAGLLAPIISVGLGVAFSTIELTRASTFLAGLVGAAVITAG